MEVVFLLRLRLFVLPACLYPAPNKTCSSDRRTDRAAGLPSIETTRTRMYLPCLVGYATQPNKNDRRATDIPIAKGFARRQGHGRRIQIDTQAPIDPWIRWDRCWICLSVCRIASPDQRRLLRHRTTTMRSARLLLLGFGRGPHAFGGVRSTGIVIPRRQPRFERADCGAYACVSIVQSTESIETRGDDEESTSQCIRTTTSP